MEYNQKTLLKKEREALMKKSKKIILYIKIIMIFTIYLAESLHNSNQVFAASVELKKNFLISKNEENIIKKSSDIKESENIQVFAGGNGSEEDPYQISTTQMFQYINKDIEANYILVEDIDLTKSPRIEKFNGKLDGNNHTIYVDFSRGNGMFDCLEKNAVVKNCNVNIGVNINTFLPHEFGAVSIENYGIIEKCITQGKVYNSNRGVYQPYYFIGGVSSSSRGTIKQCCNNINFSLINLTAGEGVWIAGICADGAAQQCMNTGDFLINVNKDAPNAAFYPVLIAGITTANGVGLGYANECANIGNINISCSSSWFFRNFCGGVIEARYKPQDASQTIEDNQSCFIAEDIVFNMRLEDTSPYYLWSKSFKAEDIRGIKVRTREEILNWWDSLFVGIEKPEYIDETLKFELFDKEKNMKKGENFKLSGKFKFGNPEKLEDEIKKIKWESSNSDVAIINEFSYYMSTDTGTNEKSAQFSLEIIANSSGKATITGISEDGKMVSCTILVTEKDSGVQNQITLTPANGSVYKDTLIDGKTIIEIETTGKLEISNNNTGYMAIHFGDDLVYIIYGNGEAIFNKENEKGNQKWEDLGIEIDSGENYLKVAVPDLDRGKVNIEFGEDFIKIDGQAFNTYLTDSDKPINEWTFNLLPDMDSNFSFKNTRVNNISKNLVARLYPPAQINKIYNKNYGGMGICFGMSVANAGMIYEDFLNLSDFEGNLISIWELKSDSKNKVHALSAIEFAQVCHLSFHLSSINKVINGNASRGNKKNPKKIEELVSAVKKFVNSGGKNPVIVSFANHQNKDDHAVLVYNYLEENDKTRLVVYDSNYPGIEKNLVLYKNNSGYTGEWYYNNHYYSSEEKNTYITFSQPLETMKQVYNRADKYNNKYILQIYGKIDIPEQSTIFSFNNIGDLEEKNDSQSKGKELYWVEEETDIPLLINGNGGFSLSGNTVELSCDNLEEGSINISTNMDNYNMDIIGAGNNNNNISYTFYNNTKINKIDVFANSKNETISIHNQEQDIYIEGAEEIKIVYVNGFEDENGNYIETAKEEKSFSDLNHEREYLINIDGDKISVELEKQNIKYGDINGDGDVNSKDAVLLKKYLAGYTGLDIDTTASDVNADGNIDSKDAVRLLRRLAGYEVILEE